MKKDERKYKAGDICELLAIKHARDLFIDECKDGPTHSSNHLRMDAWAMRKSWVHMSYVGYEIKVSRADFLGDQKLIGYLPLCNELYVVAPAGVLDVSELPPEIGYIRVNGSRLFTMRKAPHRQIECPETLLQYVLMCRVKAARYDPGESTLDYWRRWLATKAESREIGYRVSRALSERYQNDVTQVRCRVEAQERTARETDEFREAFTNELQRLGIGSFWWRDPVHVAGMVAKRAAVAHSDDMDIVRKGVEALQRVIAHFDQADKPVDPFGD